MKNKTLNRKINFIDYILELILIVMSVIIGICIPSFFSSENLLNILRNVSIQGVIALGMTMAMVCGQMDLSVGSGVAFYGVIIATLTGKISDSLGISMDYTVIISVVVAFVLSVCVGLLIGLIHLKLKIPTLVISLAFQNILFGLAAIISGGFPVSTLPSWYGKIGAGTVGGVPVPAIILIIILIISIIIMKYTKLGREMYATGGNLQAAKLCGINTGKVIVSSLIAVQLMTALSGIMVSSQVRAASATFGKGFELSVISAAIIGGVGLNGGKGKPWSTFVGAAFFGVVANGMTLLNVNEYMQFVVKGCLIILAVAMNNMLSIALRTKKSKVGNIKGDSK